MKTLAFAALFLTAFGCSRTSSQPHAALASDAGAPSSVVDAAVITAHPADAGITLDAYCAAATGAGGGVPENFTCRGEEVRPSCDVQEKKRLATLGKIVLVDEKIIDGTHAMLALVDASGHFSILERVQTEDCDLGDPADVSLALVSASEIAEGGAPAATIVVDSLRYDPPFQGGARILTAERRSIRCQAGAGAPHCDEPATLGTFTGPETGDKPPPFSQWKRAR